MDLEGKKLLITGASGFIGSHLTEELVNLGYDVRVFVRYTSDGNLGDLHHLSTDLLKKIEIVRGDLKNYDSVLRAVKDVDVIFHLGALISIPYSYLDPRDFVETNITGTLNILNAAKNFNTKKIIITSTSETYGTATYTPMDEDHPLQAQSPYSASKISADKLAESFYKSFDLPVAIIRPFNTYGPRQSMRAVLPTIIYHALAKDKLKLGSLSPQRDLTFVKDTVLGFIKIAESEKSVGEIINIGSGRTISIGELVGKVSKILNKELIVEEVKEKIRPEKSEVDILLCNNEKAKNLVGWEPIVSLDEGITEVISYVRENLDRYDSERDNL